MGSIICTPRVVLRLCGSFEAHNDHENSGNEQQKPHGRLYWPHAENASLMLLFPSSRDETRRIATNVAKLAGLLDRKIIPRRGRASLIARLML
jgi:hypothetical protein